MTQASTGYIEIDDGKFYYERGGEGETLVLVHAGFVDSRMWDDQWDAFRQHYKVIRVDMRGFGRSDPATGPVVRRQDLYEVLQQLEVDRAYLLGCSMGGEIVIDLALEHPELANALIVVSAMPSGFEMQGPPPPAFLEMLKVAEAGDLSRVSELQLRLWIDGSSRQPEQVNPGVRQRAGEMTRIAVENKTWAIADGGPFQPLDPPAVQRLGDLHIPVLIIDGGLDHPEVLRAAKVMATEIPNAQPLILADSAHMPNMEQPTEFNQAVLAVLGRAERDADVRLPIR